MKTLIFILTILIIVSCNTKTKPVNNSVELTTAKILMDSIETKLDNSTKDSVKLISSKSAFCCFEETPYYVGGESERLRYLTENTSYPQTAIDDSIEGIVYLAFIINENGSISDVKILRGIRDDIDNECIKVTKNMPNWIPGKLFGKSSRVQFCMPIRFSLNYNAKYEDNCIYPNPKKQNDTKILNDFKTKIYPNPATDFINIETSIIVNDLIYQIINSKGQILKKGQILSDNESIDIYSLVNGIYFIRLTSNGLSMMKTEKLIKK